MKKIITLVLAVLLCGFLTNIASNSKAELYPNSSDLFNQGASANNFKTGMVAPGKDKVQNKEAIVAKAAALAVPFVQNAGQFNAEVKYAADLFAGRFFLTNKELVYSLVKRSGKKNAKQDKHRFNPEPEKSMPGKGLAFKEFFVDKKGSKIDFKSSGEEQAATKVSYFRGNDPNKWHSGVDSYQSVSLGRVYPGVEVKLKASGKNVEKIFYVSPQSNVAEIKIGVAGIARLKVAKDGRLIFKNSLGELAMRTPIAWQEIDGQRHEVKVGYRLLGKNSYGLMVLGVYNKNYTLVIDPELDTLLASTYLGGKGVDFGNSLALDSTGNVYLTGFTYSTDFPSTIGAYDQIHNGGYGDVFVSKLNSNLTTLLASTYLGGSNTDAGESLALDSAGNVYVTGETASVDFPTTPRAYDRTYNEGSLNPYVYGDAYISKLSNNLTALLASTFLGGSEWERGRSLDVDEAGNVYLTGETRSADFPTTPGVYDQTRDKSMYIAFFISKLDSNLTTLLTSTYLEWSPPIKGECFNSINHLVLDSSGCVYLTGWINSEFFPTTPGAYDQTFNGYLHYEHGSGGETYYYDRDVFISKLDGGLTRILASTYLGGTEDEFAAFLSLDKAGNVYLTGGTESLDFPTTPGAYDQTFNIITYRHSDIFISKLDGNLNTLLASTFLGGSKADWADSLVLDNEGNVYLAGNITSPDFPTTPGAYDQTSNDNFNDNLYENESDVFVSRLSTDLSILLASTLLGGSGSDWGVSLAQDGTGSVFVTGSTGANDFPTTEGAFDRTFNGKNGYDVFISKLNGGFYSVKLDLLAERREIKAFSILRYFGQIQFTVDNPGIPVSQYRIMRRQGSGDFVLLKAITPSELQNNQFQMQDKYLAKDTQYTYRVEAYNAAEQLIGISLAKTI